MWFVKAKHFSISLLRFDAMVLSHCVRVAFKLGSSLHDGRLNRFHEVRNMC